MKTRVTFTEKPYPHTPIGTGRQTYIGELKGDWLWCECPVSVDQPMGRFAVNVISRAVQAPQEAEPAQQVKPQEKRA